ncbi:MAG TPA: 6-carboxytetrahydropterin synthase QueD [Candidatus Deferrimicrobiaceae bacterium]|jgi:6-pyruvoyltetrahydropterin/6-carboxytetrahydropterin synthase
MSKELYTLTVKSDFAAAHRLREYDGNCERLHGHNWLVEVSVTTGTLDARGMAVDFRVIKTALNEVLGQLDHAYLNDVSPFSEINPSSENISRFIYDEVTGRMPPTVRVSSVVVWESTDARAEYSRVD